MLKSSDCRVTYSTCAFSGRDGYLHNILFIFAFVFSSKVIYRLLLPFSVIISIKSRVFYAQDLIYGPNVEVLVKLSESSWRYGLSLCENSSKQGGRIV